MIHFPILIKEAIMKNIDCSSSNNDDIKLDKLDLIDILTDNNKIKIVFTQTNSKDYFLYKNHNNIFTNTP